jgi:hypothetical protein
LYSYTSLEKGNFFLCPDSWVTYLSITLALLVNKDSRTEEYLMEIAFLTTRFVFRER